MEPNESSGHSYFHHQIPHHPQPPQPQPQLQPQSPLNHAGAATSAASPNNGLQPATAATATAATAPMAYSSHAVPSTVSSGALVESVKRKRGRPRKYNTPGEAAAAKRQASASATSPTKKKDLAFSGGSGGSAAASSKKYQLASMGNSGQSFTPHVISVTAGEDVHQKITMFSQQCKRELCILSASGAISNASLLQPATSGGSIAYEGRFDILSLCGSYVRTSEQGGRSGGLSICLSSTDGQIIGGGVGGPLIAAGPVQVIVGTFVIDLKKDGSGGRGEASAGQSPPPMSAASNPGVSMWSTMDSPFPTSMGGSHFVIQSGHQPQSHADIGNTFTVDGMDGGSSQSNYGSVFPKWNQRASHSKLDEDS